MVPIGSLHAETTTTLRPDEQKQLRHRQLGVGREDALRVRTVMPRLVRWISGTLVGSISLA